MEVSLGYFKMMLYQYVLVNNPEPKTESDLEADHHLSPGKKHTAEELLHLCFGSCKGPWGHIPVSAPVIHHLVPHQLAQGCLIPQVGPQPCTAALGAPDKSRSLPPVTSPRCLPCSHPAGNCTHLQGKSIWGIPGCPALTVLIHWPQDGAFLSPTSSEQRIGQNA